jgi:hypothetical protein
VDWPPKFSTGPSPPPSGPCAPALLVAPPPGVPGLTSLPPLFPAEQATAAPIAMNARPTARVRPNSSKFILPV